jgi:small subunit ribosomal protein S10
MKSKYQIKIQSVNKEALKFFREFLAINFKKTALPYSVLNLPTRTKKITLLKSPHVNKTAREQFQVKRYSSMFQIKEEIESGLLNAMLLNKPKVVMVKVKTL